MGTRTVSHKHMDMVLGGHTMQRIIDAYHDSEWPIIVTLAILAYMTLC